MKTKTTAVKIKTSGLRAKGEQLIRDGKIPRPDEVLAAVAERREGYQAEVPEAKRLSHIPEFESSGSSPGRTKTQRNPLAGCALPDVPSSPPARKEGRTVQDTPDVGAVTEPAGVISLPEKKKHGRPPKNAVAMTPAERKAASRANQKQKEQDAERADLIAALIKQADMSEGVEKRWYLRDLMELSIEDLRERKNLIAELMEIYRSRQAHVIGKAEKHRRIARQQERQHLRDLTGLSIEDLRLALKGLSDLPDTRGRLANERMSGQTGMPEIERIAAARERNAHGRRVEPKGAGPD